jgi:peptidoglycan/LPS O-acetylase OafA/YrhL
MRRPGREAFPAGRARVATREQGYMQQLDALRFFAVMGVVLIHSWQPSPDTPVVGQVDWANLGVRLFFVLSGFLITGILLAGRERTQRLLFMRQFYVRRFLRIFPIYYAVLLLLLVAGVGQIREIWPWLFGYATNIYIFDHLAFPYAVPHFWTLAVEEQFYLVWPWLMLFLPRRWLVLFLGSLCVVGPAWRLYAGFQYSAEDLDEVLTFTAGVIDFLAIGALLAIAAHDERRKAQLQRVLTFVALPVGAILYLSLFRADTHFAVAFADTGAALVFCWLVATASKGFTGVVGHVLDWKPIVYLGKISYGIYIYHFLVPLAFAAAATRLGIGYEDSGVGNFIATSLVTFAVAAVSWHVFEAPINGLKRYFRYERTMDVPPAERAIAPSAQAISP